jgi:resolvase-like protein
MSVGTARQAASHALAPVPGAPGTSGSERLGKGEWDCRDRSDDATHRTLNVQLRRGRQMIFPDVILARHRESIDTTSPTGRLLLGVLGSFAEFERERIRERIHAGLARARRQGQKLGRRRQRIATRDLERVTGLTVREAAKALGVPASRVDKERRRLLGNGADRARRMRPASEPAEPGVA